MKARLQLIVLIVVVGLGTVIGYQRMADAGGEASEMEISRVEASSEDEIIGIWRFPLDGYYVGFDGEGRLCYGASEESVAAKRWCNSYTLEDGVVTETCMGGPEDRNCPLGGGVCKARVSVSAGGQLHYRILRGQCDMLEQKVIPPREYTFSRN